MELVSGVSAKQWLRTNPPLLERYAVWKMFATAAKTAYDNGVYHGDPHTGNILVFKDPQDLYRMFRNDVYGFGLRVSLGVKLTDFGTSRTWNSDAAFKNHERRVLIETACRLISEKWIRSGYKAWPAPKDKPERVLEVLDRCIDSYVVQLPGEFD